VTLGLWTQNSGEPRDAKALVFNGGASDVPIATVRVRDKKPTGDESELLEYPLAPNEAQVSIEEASGNMLWAAAVAEFAEILRDSAHSEGAQFDEVRDLALMGMPLDTPSHVESLGLVDSAEALWGTSD